EKAGSRLYRLMGDERGKDPEIKSTLEAALSRVQDPKHELVEGSSSSGSSNSASPGPLAQMA
ncbi:unnamed protein product, partial [Symbiodinium pilosum]